MTLGDETKVSRGCTVKSGAELGHGVLVEDTAPIRSTADIPAGTHLAPDTKTPERPAVDRDENRRPGARANAAAAGSDEAVVRGRDRPVGGGTPPTTAAERGHQR